MSPILEGLLRLQERDQRLSALRRELENIPSEKAARQNRLAHLEKTREEARKRSREIEVERKALEVEVSGLEERIQRYKTQQMQTRKNEEYSALAHEIEAAQKTISGLEDKELVLMEEADALTPALARADADFAAGQEEISRQLASLEKKKENLTVDLQALEASRAELTAGLEEDVLDRYERLFRSKNGQAVVPLEGAICGGCHMSVPAQTQVEAKGGQSLVSCPQCGRLLYAV